MKRALCLAVALPLHTGLGREPSEHRVTHPHSPHSREQFQIAQPGGENGAPHREANKGDVPTVLDADLPAPIHSAYKDLQSVGVKPFLDLYGVFLGNPVGGQAHLGKYAQETILGFEFDLEKIVDLEGGRVVTSAGWGYGRQLSQFIPNDIAVNEAYIEASIALFNLYYGQKLMDNRLELRVGRMGSGQLFASLPAFSVQVNGGINGNPNALYENISFYSSAGSTWTGYAKYNPTPASYLSVGIQQAGPDIGSRASHGIDFGIGPNNGVLTLFEAGWKRGAHEQASHSANGADHSQQGDDVLPGDYIVGAYYQHLEQGDFAGGTISDAYGFYWMAQQMVWRSAQGRESVSIWGGMTIAPQVTTAFNPLFGFAGTIWQGIIPGRPDDQFLCTALIGNYGDNYRQSLINNGQGDPTFEMVLETSYLIQLTQNLSFQPDLQYVIRPKGTGQIPNALVLGFQIIAEF